MPSGDSWLIQAGGLDSNRLPTWQRRFPRHSKSFIGSCAASIGVSAGPMTSVFGLARSRGDVAAGISPVLLREDRGGRFVGYGPHRGGVLGQDEPVGDAAVERVLPFVEVRLSVGVELMQFGGGERPAVTGE